MEKRTFLNLALQEPKAAIYIVLKLFLFAIVLYALYRQTGNISFKNFQLTISKPAIAIAFIIFQLRYVLMATRIYFSARLQGVMVSIKDCIILIYQTWFMVFVVPLPDSEDLFKFLFFKSNQVSAEKTLQIILYDRIGALLALAFIGVCSLLILIYAGEGHYFSKSVKMPLVSVVLMCIAAVTHKWWLKKLTAVMRRCNNMAINKAAQLLENISTLHTPVKVLSVAFALSVLYHLSAFFIILILLNIPFNAALWAAIGLGVPLFYISAIIPLSYQGLGLYETSMFAYLTFLKIPASLVTQVAMLHFLFYIILIFTGGVFFIKGESIEIRNLKKTVV